MGMSTHVVGFRPPDEQWKKMKAVRDACLFAQIDPPEAVEKFFNYETPDDTGATVSLREYGCVTKYADDSVSGVEVDLSKLPKGITILRFYNSW